MCATGSALRSDPEAVFLCGAPGVGKTTIGRRLARTLGRPFIDTDALVVEQTGRSISAIFAEQGEPAFRALESDALAVAAKTAGAVIALGGGSVLAAENRALIALSGRSIHLRATLATLERRLAVARAARPLLAAGIPIGTLLAQRLPLYAAADYTVDVDRRSLGDIIAEICTLL